MSDFKRLEYHLIVAHDTKAISHEDFVSLIAQTITVRKMLYGLLKRISVPEHDPKSQETVRRRP